MTEIIAIVRRNKARMMQQELTRIGCQGYSRFAVLGRGRQRGLRGEETAEGLPFLPKVLFDLVVEDEAAQETIEAIIRANQTGEFGDGKIFVLQMEEAYRMSTGERGHVTQEAEVQP
jgi:nitrogen regulatory protein PII